MGERKRCRVRYDEYYCPFKNPFDAYEESILIMLESIMREYSEPKDIVFSADWISEGHIIVTAEFTATGYK